MMQQVCFPYCCLLGLVLQWRPKGENMNYQEGLSQGLVDEILATIYKYEESIMLSTALGCLEIAKMHLVTEHLQEEDDD